MFGPKWYEQGPTGLRMVVHYRSALQAVPATVFLDAKSVIEFASCKMSKSEEPATGAIKVSSPQAGAVSLYPSSDLRLAVSITPLASGPGNPAVLPTQGDVPLLSGSRIRLLWKDESAIIGFDNSLDVSNADRKETIVQGQVVEIAEIRDHSQIMSLEIKDGIAAKIKGRAGFLTVDKKDERPSPAEYLRAQKILSTWLTTAILIGTAGLTVASRIRLVKLAEKDS